MRCQEFLTLLAEARQATLSGATKELYSRQLKGYDIRDVEKAVMELAREPRESFKAPFPELGALIRKIEAVRDSRSRRPKHVACGMNGCKGGYLVIRDAKYSYAAECDCLKRWRGGEQVALPDPIAEHLREVQERPEGFVPVDACIQVGRSLTAAKLERMRSGKPMSDGEYRDLKKKLTNEMNRKWLEQLASGHTVTVEA